MKDNLLYDLKRLAESLKEIREGLIEGREDEVFCWLTGADVLTQDLTDAITRMKE